MNMVTLSIDGIEVTVKRGSTILEAAEKAGVRIPTLCHDKRLIPFGSCRLCVVEQKGRRGLMPACFFPVRQGMEILTNTPNVIEARKANLELILVNHPLECPVCDAAGNCELQRLVYEYEVFENPYRLRPRKKDPVQWKERPYIGKMAVRQLDRCVHCGRCVRMCTEVVGVGEIQFLGRGITSSVGTDFDRPLDCEFCGQCVDTCPVGALSLKLNSRYWELEKTPTVCSYCSLGCAILMATKKGKVKAILSDDSIGANERNLCSKGRFGWGYVHSGERLSEPLIRRNGRFVPCSWEEAIGEVAKTLKKIKEREGPDSIGTIGSSRLTNEEAYLLQKFMRTVIGTNNLDNSAAYSNDASIYGMMESLGYPASTNSIREIRESDVILLFRSDLRDTHPVAKIEVVLATTRNRAKLIAANPMKTELNRKAAISIIYRPQTELVLINGMLNVILNEGFLKESFCNDRVDGLDGLKKEVMKYTPQYCQMITGVEKDLILDAARTYGQARKGVIIISTGLGNRGYEASIAKGLCNLALVTGNIGQRGKGIFVLGEKCNSQGVMDMGLLPGYLPGYIKVSDRELRRPIEEEWGVKLPEKEGLSALGMIDAAEKGKLKALYILGTDPIVSYPDSQRTIRAIENLEFLIVQDIFMTETASRAHLILPAATFAEKDGTYTSAERRIQRLNRAIHQYGKSRSDLVILRAISEEMGRGLTRSGSLDDIWREIGSLVPFLRGVKWDRIGPRGIQWPCFDEGSEGTPVLYEGSFPQGKARLFPVEAGEITKPDGEFPFYLLTGTTLLHSGTLSQKAEGLKELCPEAYCEINPSDAEKLGIEDRFLIRVSTRKGSIQVRARISERTPEGTIFIPYNFPNVRVNDLTERDKEASYARIEKM